MLALLLFPSYCDYDEFSSQCSKLCSFFSFLPIGEPSSRYRVEGALRFFPLFFPEGVPIMHLSLAADDLREKATVIDLSRLCALIPPSS